MMELSERKLKILAAIVDMYVATGEPVGSKVICEALGCSVSSATVRNEMAELVNLGYLEQPHTSAGRVPSHAGYRLYINKLMDKKPLSGDEKSRISDRLYSGADTPEEVLTTASQVLADMTNYAAVSTAPHGTSAKIKKLKFVQTGRHSAMVVLITSSGMVKNKLFRCDYVITSEILRVFDNVLNDKFDGVYLSVITPVFIQTVAASLGEIAILVPNILVAILEATKEALQTNISLDGEANLLFLPEFELGCAKRLFDYLNRRSDIANLILGGPSDTTVLVGNESRVPELEMSSVIITRYHIKDGGSGAMAIIGPTRMNYSKTITSLEYLAETVGTLLSEILDIE